MFARTAAFARPLRAQQSRVPAQRRDRGWRHGANVTPHPGVTHRAPAATRGQMHPQIALDFASLGLHRELFAIGPLALRWYSLAYIAGILLAWAYVARMLRQPAAPMTAADADALVTWATVGIIAGGRIAYVLFYDLPRFAAHPIDILKIWEGGMSFHGGAFGVGIAILLYARSHRLSWLRICDYIACSAPIGLFLGRCANFVNGELWGRPTGHAWGMIFPGAGPEPRYPSQLMEAGLEGVALFAILAYAFWRTRARLHPGQLTGLFLAGYGVFRFIIEFFREPDAQLEDFAHSVGLSMGQLLCIPMVLGGLYLMLTAARRRVPVMPTAGLEPQQ
jgi:phosphatidylglycerol:prolipoprotein diacylglycerol transferase